MREGSYKTLLVVVLGAHLFLLFFLGTLRPYTSLGLREKKLVVQTVELHPQPKPQPKAVVQKEPPKQEEIAEAPPPPPPKKTPPKKKVEKKVVKKKSEEKKVVKQQKKEKPSEKLSASQKEKLQKAREALTAVKESSKATKSTPVKKLSKVSIAQESLISGYSDKLTGALRKNLILPEYGEVKVKLTLLRSGEVKKVEVLSSESRTNRREIVEKLKGLKLAPFGNNFPGEKEHDFVIVLSNDL